MVMKFNSNPFLATIQLFTLRLKSVLFQEPLPNVPLSGMLNKHGGKVRLTFKSDQDQLWLGTKERTEKLAMTSIKSKLVLSYR